MAKKLIILGMVLGSYAGSYIPAIWGGSLFSLSSILFGAAGGFAGIWVGYKLARRFE
jgi:hypothetical protein